MKHLKFTLILAAALAAGTLTASASSLSEARHDSCFQDRKDPPQRPKGSREDFAKKQGQFIAHEAGLSEENTARFVELYEQCQKEMWSRPKDKDEKTDAVAKRFEREQALLDICKKYYGLYSKFLSSAEIEKVYRAEQKMRNHFMQRKNGKRPGPGGPRPEMKKDKNKDKCQKDCQKKDKKNKKNKKDKD